MNNPNRVALGKAGAGRFDFKTNTESDIELTDDEFAPPVKPRVNSFGLAMLKIAADNHRDAGEQVPPELQARIDQVEEENSRYEAYLSAREAADSIHPESTPDESSTPEPVYDLSTDEGRFAAASDAESKMESLLKASTVAEEAVRKVDYKIRELRSESYKGISFDTQRLQEQAQPLRDAARKAHEAYIAQRQAWDNARDYAHAHRSEALRDREYQLGVARSEVASAKSALSLLIHNHASEEEKDAARKEWFAATDRFRKLKETAP